MPGDALASLDDAFLRLRRLWSTSRQRIIQADGSYVELSTLLVVEACARGATDGVAVWDVADFADVAHSTASRLVQRAVDAGFVQRGLPPFGGRRSVLYLTRAGKSLHGVSLAARVRWLDRQLDGWPTGAVDDLAHLLHTFADTLDGQVAFGE